MVMMVRSDGAVIARWPIVEPNESRLESNSALSKAMAAGDMQGRIEGCPRSTVRIAERVSPLGAVSDLCSGRNRPRRDHRWMATPVGGSGSVYVSDFDGARVCRVGRVATYTAGVSLSRVCNTRLNRARIESAMHHVQRLEALGRLTGGVAHDFNNLLTIVSNNLHLMRRLDPALADNKQLAAMGRAVASGERLTRQLLAFARRQPLQPEVISIQERLPALLALIAPTLGPHIESSVDVDPKTRPVLTDPAELELAVINLAVNAKDAMPEGGQLTLSARNARPAEIDIAGEFVVLTVADTGTGIDAELTERIFEPFFTTKPPEQGTGLGLSQVYGLCAQAGGTVRVESKPGQGTRVSLYLPATDPMPSTPDAQIQPDDRKLDCTVLLVEDNEEVAVATQPLLQTVGCTVQWAHSGAQAQVIIDAEPGKFDIVLSDMAMPGEPDGLGLAEYLRKRYPEIQVVLMTGYTNQLQEAVTRRFTVLAKPCSPDVLMNAMRDAIRRRNASRRLRLHNSRIKKARSG